MVRKTLSILLAITVALTIYLFYSYRQTQQTFIRDETKKYATVTNQIATQIDSLLSDIKNDAYQVSKEITAKSFNDKDLKDYLSAWLKNDQDLLGVGVAYLPNKRKTSQRLASFYFQKEGNEIKANSINEIDDYTQDRWYNDCINGRKDVWYGPFTNSTEPNRQKLRFTTPLYQVDAATNIYTIIGVVVCDASEEKVTGEFLTSTALINYGFAVTSEELLIAHTTPLDLRTRNTLEEIIIASGHSQWKDVAEKAFKGERDVLWMRNPQRNDYTLLIYEPLSSIHGFIGISATSSYTDQELAHFKRLRLGLQICVGIALMLILLFALRLHEVGTARLWIFSSAITVLLVALSALLWPRFFGGEHFHLGEHAHQIFTKEQVDLYLKVSQKVRGVTEEHDILIPTGVYVTDFSLLGDLAVMNGYVWQHYSDRALKTGIDPKVRFANESEEHPVTLKEMYRTKQDDGELIGWYFSGGFAQSLEFDRYPIDSHLISIKFSVSNPDKGFILVPDFDSWKGKPEHVGLSPLLDWDIWNNNVSFYNFIVTSLPTNLGIKNFKDQKNFVELEFNFDIERKFFSVLLLEIIVLLSILVVIFICLLFGDKMELDLTFIINIF